MAVLGWIGKRLLRAVGDDIKASVVDDLRDFIKTNITETTKPILDQFSKNGGSTLKDGQDRLEKGQQEQAKALTQVKDMVQSQGKTLGEHIAYHKGQESKTAPRRATPRKAVAK